jgi:hypothetical protein
MIESVWFLSENCEKSENNRRKSLERKNGGIRTVLLLSSLVDVCGRLCGSVVGGKGDLSTWVGRYTSATNA